MPERKISDLEIDEVRVEIRKLNDIFKEGFLNNHLDFVICHPLYLCEIYEEEYLVINGKVYTIPKRGLYCNIFFQTSSCKTKQDVQRSVIEWFSRDAYKTRFYGGRTDELIHKYVLDGINAYLKTDFTEEQIEHIYTYLGNGVNRELCVKFIESGFDLSVLPDEAKASAKAQGAKK